MFISSNYTLGHSSALLLSVGDYWLLDVFLCSIGGCSPAHWTSMGDCRLLDLLDDLIFNSSVGKILGGDVATILSCNENKGKSKKWKVKSKK